MFTFALRRRLLGLGKQQGTQNLGFVSGYTWNDTTSIHV